MCQPNAYPLPPPYSAPLSPLSPPLLSLCLPFPQPRRPEGCHTLLQDVRRRQGESAEEHVRNTHARTRARTQTPPSHSVRVARDCRTMPPTPTPPPPRAHTQTAHTHTQSYMTHMSRRTLATGHIPSCSQATAKVLHNSPPGGRLRGHAARHSCVWSRELHYRNLARRTGLTRLLASPHLLRAIVPPSSEQGCHDHGHRRLARRLAAANRSPGA